MNELNNVDQAGVYGKDSPVTAFVPDDTTAQRHRHLGCLATVWMLVLACLGLSIQATAANDTPEPQPYRLGEGLRLPGGFGLGGYATASVNKLQHEPARETLDNTSLFLWWEGEGRWKFFSEFDFQNPLNSHSTGREDGDRYLALERFYVDYAFDETTNIRAGKFLTPIGRWNQIHATPLVWTSSRPLVTQQTFPSNVTGLMLGGTLGSLGDTEYSLYASSGNEIRANPDLDPFNEVIGGHLVLPPLGGVRIGLSYASFEQKKTRGERKELYGIDFVWSKNRYEISGEGVYRFSENGSNWDEKGAFIQGVAPLDEKLYLVGRYENFHKALSPQATEIWVLGLNYRLTPAIVLKAEWGKSRNNTLGVPEGFLSSVSILF